MHQRSAGILPTLLALTLSAVACSAGATTPAAPSSNTPTSAGEKVMVSVRQWAVAPSVASVPAGTTAFSVTNTGSITHEFVVLRTDTPAADIRIESFEGEKDRINEDTAGTNEGETGDMPAGATRTVTIDLQPGHYVLFCNLPAHYGLGMHADFNVS